jgi:hypothetical protein
MMKKIIRVSLSILAIASILFVVPQLILSYPAFLFAEEFNYKNVTILSNEKVATEMKGTLDIISTKLLTTGFYVETDQIKIILCSKRSLANFLEKISLTPAGVGFHHFSGNIYLFPGRIDQFREENLKVKGEEKRLLEYTYQTFEFDKILTHEILHKLHSDSLGILEFKQKMPPPHWKAEGFAEYYTFITEKEKSKDYDFRDRVTLYLRYKDKFPLTYYRAQLLYEFLTEYRHMDFTDLMQEEVTEQETYDELIKWYNQNNW